MSLNYQKKDLFDFMLDRVKEKGGDEFKKFPDWFIKMYFQNVKDIFSTDGARDNKIDLFFSTYDDENIQHFVINSKFTKKYNETAPSKFYDEILSFVDSFNNINNYNDYLSKYVRKDLRNKYSNLYDLYDKGKCDLIFLTNYKKNVLQYSRVSKLNVRIFHLEDILQFMIDDLEGAMPRTNSLILTNISNVLSADKKDTIVPTSIVFARLYDFIQYMKKDPYDLLFARNIRLDLGNTGPNKDIKSTFKNLPKEFAFSNNGITLLCEEHFHSSGNQELEIKNPRVVNGSQTLHSVRHISSPSKDARVMVRIIQVKPVNVDRLNYDPEKRKEIIHKISVRSNKQNTISNWNLVSNDEFQQELKRYFRKKEYFYETRKKEWSFRKTELINVGIKKGPFLPKLMQYISSYYYNSKSLGPAIAKGNLNKLFENNKSFINSEENDGFEESKSYDIIANTKPNLVYQIYLLSELVNYYINELSRFKYIAIFRKHINFCLFALTIKSIKDSSNVLGNNDFTEYLENNLNNNNTNYKVWKKLLKREIDIIIDFYKRENEKYKRQNGKPLTLNNFFKTQSYVSKIFDHKIPSHISKNLKQLLIN